MKSVIKTVVGLTIGGLFIYGLLYIGVLYPVKALEWNTRFEDGTLVHEPNNKTVETPYINATIDHKESVFWLYKNFSTFSSRRPRFVDNKSKELFYKSNKNIKKQEEGQTHALLRGKICIIKNGRLVKFNLMDDCPVERQIKRNGKVKPSNWLKYLVPFTFVDSGIFQHFQDFVLPRLLQALPIIRAYNVTILIRKPRDNILYEFFEKLNISSQIRFYNEQELYGADYMIYSCIRYSYHPMIWRESRRLLGVHTTRTVPIKDAYVIVLTRKGCFNCGRHLINQDKVVDMLQKRYGKSVVKVFKGPKPLNFSFDLFGKARIIIGPHGGGFYNLNFAPEGTNVVEFMPTKPDGKTDIPGERVFYQISDILQQPYWRIALPPGKDKSMLVNITQLESLLDIVDEEQSNL